jgi:curved DNA-binding protein CbpA
MQHDYYQVLSVDPNANFEAIRNAYRQCALRYHPDRGGSHEQMIIINEAWEILSDPERRQRYDSVRLNTANPTVQAAAATDVQQAHQQAEQYPRRWADFEVWLDGVAKDFDKAEFKPGRWGFGVLQLFPLAGDSQSGNLFTSLGAVLGFITFLSVFFGVLKLYTGLEPPYYEIWLKDQPPLVENTKLEDPFLEQRCDGLSLSPLSSMETQRCHEIKIENQRQDAKRYQEWDEYQRRYVPPYNFFVLFSMSLVGGAWVGVAAHKGLQVAINQSRRQLFQQTAEQREKEAHQAEAQRSETRHPKESEIIVCSNCGQKLRVPIRSSRLLVKCKKCQHEFYH